MTDHPNPNAARRAVGLDWPRERWSPDLIEAAGGIENVPAYLRMEARQRRGDLDRPIVQFMRVVAVSFRRGQGVGLDPVRIVTNYFDDATGKLLFEDDPIVALDV